MVMVLYHYERWPTLKIMNKYKNPDHIFRLLRNLTGQAKMNSNNTQEKQKVFSKMLRAGGKNYFFDVKQASNGSNYLTITDSYKNQKGESVTNRVLIFKDHAQDFATTLAEAGSYLK
jgi:hypothetical protein